MDEGWEEEMSMKFLKNLKGERQLERGSTRRCGVAGISSVVEGESSQCIHGQLMQRPTRSPEIFAL